MRFLALLTVVLMIVAAGRGAADEAADAYARGDYATAFKLYLQKAQQGDAGSQARVGYMYLNGEGVMQDDAEALRWYRKAAEQGRASSQFNLGVMYATGRGVKQDDAEAVRWYRKAAEQGYVGGQFNLGVMYAKGRGVKQDDVEAVRWYRRAAKQGDADSQFNLGVMYETGRGVKKDDAEAVRWYRKAAEQGDASAQVNLGTMYESGKGVMQDEAEAVRWYRKAAEQGDRKGQLGLALMYRAGRGVKQDDAEAVRWYRKAAEQGDAEAQVRLGFMYDTGSGCPRDYATALQWIERAAAQGEPDSYVDLGECYEYGKGTAASRDQALAWYGKAAASGSAEAKVAVARLERGFWGAGNLQKMLAFRGFDPGPKDGRFTDATLAAAQRYRSAVGLSVGEYFVTGIHNQLLADMDRALQEAEETRGATVVPRQSGTVDFGTYHALVIGNQNYRPMGVLKTPLADARSVATLLETQYGFRVNLLLDASRSQILDAIQSLREKLELGDNLLIYYAGHGDIDRDTDRGYWLPVEADSHRSTWCAHEDITNEIKGMRARHVVVVADSCYAGTLLRESGDGRWPGGSAEGWAWRMAQKRSRTALTSGGREPVQDSGGGEHSVFAQAFLKALQENDRIIDLDSLFRERIGRKVVLDAHQTPAYADIRLADHDFGDFVLVPRTVK